MKRDTNFLVTSRFLDGQSYHKSLTDLYPKQSHNVRFVLAYNFQISAACTEIVLANEMNYDKTMTNE